MKILGTQVYNAHFNKVNTINYLCKLITSGFTSQAILLIENTPIRMLNKPDQDSKLFPMQHAIQVKNMDIIVALLNKGVDLHKENPGGLTSYDTAMDSSEDIKYLFTS